MSLLRSASDILALTVSGSAVIFFIYKACAGAMMASASLDVTVSHPPSAERDGQVALGITVKISRTGTFAIRLLGGEVRIVQCLLDGRDALNAAMIPQAAPGTIPMKLADAPAGSRDADTTPAKWFRRSPKSLFFARAIPI